MDETGWGGNYQDSETSLVAQMVRNLPAMQENQVQPLGWEDLLQKGMPTPPIFLLGEFHGQGSLTDYSPWGHKELDTTEELIVSLPPPFF